MFVQKSFQHNVDSENADSKLVFLTSSKPSICFNQKLLFAMMFGALVVSTGCSDRRERADRYPRDRAFRKDIVDRRPVKPEEIDKAKKSGNPEDLAKAGLWYVYDPVADGLEGVSSERVHLEKPIDPQTTPVIVAVIDSGVDIHHEDLQGRIWVNEIEKNGQPNVDDDKNGYVDDFHGWNFIGGRDANGNPTHITNETLEVTRIAKKLLDKKQAGQALSPQEEALLAKTTKEIEDDRAAATKAITDNQKAYDDIKIQFEVIKSLVDVTVDELTLDKVKAIESKEDTVVKARDQIIEIYTVMKAKDTARLLRRINNSQESLNYSLNLEYNPRAEIVKDNPEDITDANYGNNDVKGPDGDHGTHVAGIIAALRNNDVGANGIAENVRIMVLRVVPGGDERDKDIALAVRYAVNNGARIINMSFGKGYSPQKYFVDDAMKFAASKGILLVHAAGNENKNTDGIDQFRYPNRELNEADELGNNEISTWIEVGASSAFRNESLPARFSNYGRRKVDLFAPGFELLSTVPGNKYAILSGTSMAAPSVSGVAALILSHHPNLSGVELKDYLLSSVRRYPGLKVKIPGTEDVLVPFSELSRTGGVSDVFFALMNLY
jgi:cell wall-associated protease